MGGTILDLFDFLGFLEEKIYVTEILYFILIGQFIQLHI